MLDKDDEEDNNNNNNNNNTKPQSPNGIGEEEMLDIAEGCFMRIAEAIITKGSNVREAFSKQIMQQIIKQDNGEEEEIELLSPLGFLEGVKALGISDLEEVDVGCLMRILTKPDLENAILLQELIIIMENFGI